MATYEIILVLVALAIFGAIFLPRWFAGKPLSFPIVYVGLGFILFNLSIGVPPPDPIEQPLLAERVTQLVIIIALMGAGLKIDRPFTLRAWIPSWRMLGIAMPLTIAITAFLGWSVLGFLLPTAILIGAVIAPTDPVLASDIGATKPGKEVESDADSAEQEGSIRFTLTSEAGLNDGLAFPFTYLAIVLASVSLRVADIDSDPRTLIVSALFEWLLVDFFYKIIAGVVMGYLIGKAVAYLIFGAPSTTELAEAMQGSEALAATLFAYALTELVHGYGFIAVFVSALVLRHDEWTHNYYEKLHNFAIMVERLLMAIVLVLFGGAVAGGLLAPLTWQSVAVGLAIIFVVRPLAGFSGLIGSKGTWRERGMIAAFGIRGIGSFYYLAFALNEATFQELELLAAENTLWALTGFVVLTSMVVHGIAATPLMNWMDRTRTIRQDDFDVDVD